MLSYPPCSDGAAGWLIREDFPHDQSLRRIESLFHQANGYLGVRAATEEARLKEQRGMYVAGTFDKFSPNDVTELPNIPDLVNMSISIDGQPMIPLADEVEDSEILLDMRTGKVSRRFTYLTARGKRATVCFERIVSLADRHILAQRATVSTREAAAVTVRSGIDGVVTNSGVQHFYSGKKMLLGGDVLRSDYETNQSGIHFLLLTGHRVVHKSGTAIVAEDAERTLQITPRGIFQSFTLDLAAGDKLTIEKISGVYTSRDRGGPAPAEARAEANVDSYRAARDRGFDGLLEETSRAWAEVWKRMDIEVQSDRVFDQVSIRYAIMQLVMMTPRHDNRMNIGAKGLSGEAYKGHTFWDTEVFLLPVWAAVEPEAARSLLEYRYLSLEGARRKAGEYGYEGAMFPWESAWITDGEVTPKFGAADIVTGQPLPIICGELEQHIVGDVAYGVWYYYQLTGDTEFMERAGYEIIFETAGFWQSRWEWNPTAGRYEITNVIGPDEYSEHVDNNAFVNYLSWWNVKLALDCYDRLSTSRPELLADLGQRIPLERYALSWREKLGKLYLPQVNENGLLPQDDTFMGLPEIDIAQYKDSATRAEIIKDYNMEQLSELQVSKQADVIVLMNLGIVPFPAEVYKKNFAYYEARCLHDSSLSLSMYSLAAARVGHLDTALRLFERAQVVDLNDSDAAAEGIHAASMGGLWQCLVHGFAGLTFEGGKIRLDPALPSRIRGLHFSFVFRGTRIRAEISQERAVLIPAEPRADLEVISGSVSRRLKEPVSFSRARDIEPIRWRGHEEVE